MLTVYTRTYTRVRICPRRRKDDTRKKKKKNILVVIYAGLNGTRFQVKISPVEISPAVKHVSWIFLIRLVNFLVY